MYAPTTQSLLPSLRNVRRANLSNDNVGLALAALRSVHSEVLDYARRVQPAPSASVCCKPASLIDILAGRGHERGQSSHCHSGCGCACD